VAVALKMIDAINVRTQQEEVESITKSDQRKVMSQANTSAFSAAVHSRASTSLQLRRNHFSTLALSVKRFEFAAGANGSIALAVACLEEQLSLG
jgi:hypothetical protein